MLPGKRNSTGAIYVLQGPPPAGTPFVGGIAVSQDGAIYVSQAFTPPFSPANLFASGEQGAWYDPSDLSTMFQDSAGTTPVTAVGQPVGKILDKSGRGNNATQATAAARPVLRQDANSKYYLEFDGVDDSLATAAIDFTATNKASAFAGTYQQRSAVQVVFEQENTRFGIRFNSAAVPGGGITTTMQTATTQVEIGEVSGSFPRTLVVSSSYDKSQVTANTQLSLRINQAVQSTVCAPGPVADAGFDNARIIVGSKGSDSYLLGRIYSLIVLGRLATTQEITDTETWVAAKTGVTLP